MFLKKPRVFLKKRGARRLTKLEALAALGAIALIAFLSVLAFRGGHHDNADVPLIGQETAQATPTTVSGTEVESLTLAATGIDTAPLLIGGLCMVLLGAAIEKGARRRRSQNVATATSRTGLRSSVVAA
jgi:hypothetical protein